MMQHSMPESLERPNSLEKAKGAIVEIGPGFEPMRMIPNISGIARKRIDEGVPYYAIDHSEFALGQVKEGAVIRTTLEKFADTDFLDRSVASINVFNVFGEPWSKKRRDTYLGEIFNKFHRMLSDNGHVVIGEIYTPDNAQHILALPYDAYGFEMKAYKGIEACRHALKEMGFVEDALHRMGSFPGSEKKYGEPFVIVLTSKRKMDIGGDAV